LGATVSKRKVKRGENGDRSTAIKIRAVRSGAKRELGGM